jgi:hypothetical protein
MPFRKKFGLPFAWMLIQAGGGNYQTLINNALRRHIENQKESLEETLRRVIREEFKAMA